LWLDSDNNGMTLIVVDVSRNVGKTIVLILFKIKRHFRPLRFGTASIVNPKIRLIIPAHNESVTIKKVSSKQQT